MAEPWSTADEAISNRFGRCETQRVYFFPALIKAREIYFYMSNEWGDEQNARHVEAIYYILRPAAVSAVIAQ